MGRSNTGGGTGCGPALAALAALALAGCTVAGAPVDPRLEACDAYALVAIEASALADGGAIAPEPLRQLAAIHEQQAILCDPARPAGVATAALIAANTARVVAIIAKAD